MEKIAMIKQEHSAGGVVYRRYQIPDTRYQIQFLLGKHSGYHKWVLPKGLIEEGEAAQETARREVLEEMGVRARVVGEEPVKTIRYQYWAEFKISSASRTSRSGNAGEKQPRRRAKTYQENVDFDKVSKKQLVKKRVDFFLMEWVSGEPADHDWEMEEAGWFTYEEAVKRLAFADERGVLQVANSLLVD